MSRPPSPEEQQLIEATTGVFRGQTVLDRTGRPVSLAEAFMLSTRPGYIHIAQTRVTDRMPPYFDIDVSTVWLPMPRHPLSSDIPLHFETMMQPRSACLENTALTHPYWGYANPADAAEGHEVLVQIVARQLGDPVVTPQRTSGKRRRTKPWRGMSARRRAQARRGIAPRSSGEQWVRGRRGRPDTLVMWTWNAEDKFFDVVRLPDTPAAGPRFLRGSGARKQLR